MLEDCSSRLPQPLPYRKCRSFLSTISKEWFMIYMFGQISLKLRSITLLLDSYVLMLVIVPVRRRRQRASTVKSPSWPYDATSSGQLARTMYHTFGYRHKFPLIKTILHATRAVHYEGPSRQLPPRPTIAHEIQT